LNTECPVVPPAVHHLQRMRAMNHRKEPSKSIYDLAHKIGKCLFTFSCGVAQAHEMVFYANIGREREIIVNAF